MPAYTSIVEAFGEGILDENGEIARRRLGAIVFEDEAKLKILVDITHRHVVAATMQAIERMQADDAAHGYRFIVIDAPLLIDADMHLVCDAVWVVTADDERRIARVLARDGLTREQALERMRRQRPQDELAGYADSVLCNDGGEADLEEVVDACLCGVLDEGL